MEKKYNPDCPAFGQIEEIRKLVGDIGHVEVVLNGDKEKSTVRINKIVESMYSDMEILRDTNKVHRIFKKYKVYYIIALVIAISLGVDIRFLIKQFLENIFH